MISIIIPAYNVEKYIKRCLESLYDIDIEKEIIIVNDGSTDNTLTIVEKFKKEHESENIKVVSQENKGLSEARNRGLKESSGNYVSFIDSDDFVEKSLYEKMIKEVMADNVDFGIGRFKYCTENDKKQIDIEEKPLEEKALNEHGVKTGKKWLRILKKHDKYGPEVWDDIYRREFLIKNNLYFKPGRLHEDEIFTLEVFLKAEKVKYYDISFYYYLQREESITKTKNLKNFIDMEKNIHDIQELIEKENGEMLKILIAEVHRFYKIIIKESRHYTEENRNFKNNYRKFYQKNKENKIKNIFVRLRKSLRKRFTGLMK